jgi:hypothetical protein
MEQPFNIIYFMSNNNNNNNKIFKNSKTILNVYPIFFSQTWKTTRVSNTHNILFS